ncbi:MAG: transposase [Verrucomicrobiales bacterium]|jgi:putative transposase|nr:transposase [Verrucomicrobiales bacterium]
MKKSKFSEEQVVNILREGQSGSGVKAVCAKYNISEATYYKWQKQYGGVGHLNAAGDD